METSRRSETWKRSTGIDVEMDHAVVVDHDFADVVLQHELVDEDRVRNVGRASVVQIDEPCQTRAHQQGNDLDIRQNASSKEYKLLVPD